MPKEWDPPAGPCARVEGALWEEPPTQARGRGVCCLCDPSSSPPRSGA